MYFFHVLNSEIRKLIHEDVLGIKLIHYVNDSPKPFEIFGQHNHIRYFILLLGVCKSSCTYHKTFTCTISHSCRNICVLIIRKRIHAFQVTNWWCHLFY